MKRWLSSLSSAWVLLLATLPLVSAAAPAQQWNFKVFLDDKEIGIHNFSVVPAADSTRMTTKARFDVKILFINAYQYVHDAEELWRDQCLVSMKSSTNDNGKKLSVTAAQGASGLAVSSGAGSQTLAGCVMSYAYWSPLFLKQTKLLNSQTGEYDAVEVKSLGDTSVLAAGRQQPAKRYKLTSKKLDIDLWYSPDNEWLALESKTESGRVLRYVLN